MVWEGGENIIINVKSNQAAGDRSMDCYDSIALFKLSKKGGGESGEL